MSAALASQFEGVDIDLSGLPEVINDCYYPFLMNSSRFLVFYGGAGSGKSVFVAQKLVFRTITEAGHRFICIRKVARTLRNSVFALLKNVIETWGLASLFSIHESEMRFTFLPNGNEILCLGLDDSEKIKSIFQPTGFWIEEATELLEKDLVQLDLRLRGQTAHYKQILLSFNPISEHHWLKRRFFDRCGSLSSQTVVKTTYRHNQFLDDEYRNVLEQLKIESPELYRVYALGEWGSLEGGIYLPFLRGPWPDRFRELFYGLDFGYSKPMALIEIGDHPRGLFLSEKLYDTGLTNGDLILRLPELVHPGSRIYCDSAEPDRIKELRDAGFDAVASDKEVGHGIDFCKRQRFFTHDGNVNLEVERQTYCWARDKEGKPTEDPVKFNDHLMDALRYGVYTHLGKNHGLLFPRGLSRKRLGV